MMQRFIKSRTFSRRPRAGFTLIEILIVISIFAIMTGILVANYRRFGGSLEINNLVYDVALSVREAQTYGIAVKSSSATSDSFGGMYGVHFDTATPNSYFIFSDNGNGKYDTAGDTIIKSYVLNNSFTISGLCDITDPTEECHPMLDVVYKRPNPDAYMTFLSASGAIETQSQNVSDVRVKISSPQGEVRAVRILKSGQISTESIFSAGGSDGTGSSGVITTSVDPVGSFNDLAEDPFGSIVQEGQETPTDGCTTDPYTDETTCADDGDGASDGDIPEQDDPGTPSGTWPNSVKVTLSSIQTGPDSYDRIMHDKECKNGTWTFERDPDDRTDFPTYHCSSSGCRFNNSYMAEQCDENTGDCQMVRQYFSGYDGQGSWGDLTYDFGRQAWTVKVHGSGGYAGINAGCQFTNTSGDLEEGWYNISGYKAGVVEDASTMYGGYSIPVPGDQPDQGYSWTEVKVCSPNAPSC